MMPDPEDVRWQVLATELAESLPVCEDDEPDSELISLCDIVVTAVEHGEFMHFRVRKYDPDANPDSEPWAIVEPLSDGLREGQVRGPLALGKTSIRQAVEAYAYTRLQGGLSYEEVRKLVDGSYTDVIIADAIVQFAVYGEVVFG